MKLHQEEQQPTKPWTCFPVKTAFYRNSAWRKGSGRWWWCPLGGLISYQRPFADTRTCFHGQVPRVSPVLISFIIQWDSLGPSVPSVGLRYFPMDSWISVETSGNGVPNFAQSRGSSSWLFSSEFKDWLYPQSLHKDISQTRGQHGSGQS